MFIIVPSMCRHCSSQRSSGAGRCDVRVCEAGLPCCANDPLVPYDGDPMCSRELLGYLWCADEFRNGMNVHTHTYIYICICIFICVYLDICTCSFYDMALGLLSSRLCFMYLPCLTRHTVPRQNIPPPNSAHARRRRPWMLPSFLSLFILPTLCPSSSLPMSLNSYVMYEGTESQWHSQCLVHHIYIYIYICG